METIRLEEQEHVNMSVVKNTLTDGSHVYEVRVACVDAPVIEFNCISHDYADRLLDQLMECVDISRL